MDEQLESLKAALAGRYDIERLLGSGGMAHVYLAHDVRHDRPVAVKALRAEVASSVGAERFLREIRLTAKLNHPNILALYDSGEAGGSLFYVMPFVDGPSLGQHLARERQLPIDEAVRITREIAEGLGHAHSRQLVHRDIKPENIMLSDGHVLVADFGISRAVRAAGGDRLTQTGMSIGTPAYMSPEQVAGDPNIDARSDVYSLGCVLYETLVGQIPFPAPTLQAMMARHTLDEVSRPSVMRPAVTPPLEAIVTKCLAKNPVDRFRDGKALAEALKHAGAGQTVVDTNSATTSTAPPVSHRKWSAKRWGVATVMGAAATLIVGAFLLFSRGVGNGADSEPVPTLAVLPFENVGAPDEEYFAAGLSAELIGVLSSVEGLQVAGRRSTRAYRDSNDDVREIGRSLGVATVLEGDVRKTGDDIRVSARLVDVNGGAQLWSNSYDRTVQNVFAVQEEIARSLVAELRRELVVAEGEGDVRGTTINPMAYDKYLWGQYNVERQTQAGLTDAIDNFSMSIGFDSGFADAYAGLAEAQFALIDSGVTEDVAAALDASNRAALSALRLNTRLARPHVVLGDIKLRAFDWVGAESEYVTALENAPHDPIVRERYAYLLAVVGRLDAAVVHAQAAVKQDPLSVSALETLLAIQRTDEDIQSATETGRRILQLNPEHAATWLEFGLMFLSQGRTDDARNAFEAYAERGEAVRTDIFSDFVNDATAFAEGGVVGQVQPEVVQFLETQPVKLAVIHLMVGDEDAALLTLERALRDRFPGLATVALYPSFRALEETPRFRAILADLALSPS